MGVFAPSVRAQDVQRVPVVVVLVCPAWSLAWSQLRERAVGGRGWAVSEERARGTLVVRCRACPAGAAGCGGAGVALVWRWCGAERLSPQPLCRRALAALAA